MMVEETRESKAKAFLIRCALMAIVFVIIIMTTGLAYLIYQSTRGYGLGQMMAGVIDFFKSFTNMDPVVAAWAIPMGLGLIAVIGMLVVRHFKQ